MYVYLCWYSYADSIAKMNVPVPARTMCSDVQTLLIGSEFITTTTSATITTTTTCHPGNNNLTSSILSSRLVLIARSIWFFNVLKLCAFSRVSLMTVWSSWMIFEYYSTLSSNICFQVIFQQYVSLWCDNHRADMLTLFGVMIFSIRVCRSRVKGLLDWSWLCWIALMM